MSKPAASKQSVGDQINELVRLLALISHSQRLAILRHINEVGQANASSLLDVLKQLGGAISQPAISYHISLLVAAGWLTSERRGRHVVYQPVTAQWDRLAELLNQCRPAR